MVGKGTRPLKVLLVAGVGERPEARLFPELAARGVEVTLLCDTRSPYFDPLKASGFPMTHFVMRSRVDFKAIRFLRQVIRQGRYDIVHAFNSRALTTVLLASWGVRIRRVGYCGAMGHLNRWDPSSWMGILNPRVDRIVCVSDAVLDYLRAKQVPARRLLRIYKGCDPAWFTAAPRSALRQFGIPDEAVVVACTGKMRPIKGFPVLLEAVRGLVASYPVHVLLVGENEDPAAAAWLEDPLLKGRVHLAGFRMDAPELVGACDLFAMPTLTSEGLSKSVTEAMCMGLPCVVTRAGGMVELIEPGTTGLVVDPGNAAALAEALRLYLSDPAKRRRDGEAARLRLASHFSFTTMVDEFLALYQDLTSCG